jgi:segregation and condensation protein B
VLFVADRPVTVVELAAAVCVDKRTAEAALASLEQRLTNTGLCVQRDGREVQMVTAPDAAADVQRFLGLESSAHLSGAALETLAIIAYKQPVTRPEIEDLRGVNCDGVLRTLLSRGMVTEVGRRQTVGLPIEYGTSFRFLEYFGLEGLHELPDVGDAASGAALAAGSDAGALNGDATLGDADDD